MMRRKDRAVTDRGKIREIIRSCACLRLGLWDEGEVYIVPMHFGYAEEEGKQVFYFHGAKEGRKNTLIARTHSAGFELDTGYELVSGASACNYTARYQSVIGTGKISLVEEPEAKRRALRAIMLHCTGKADWQFHDANIEKVAVFRLDVEKISCKAHE